MSRSMLRLCMLSAALAAPVAADEADAVLSAVNGARAKAGCPALVLDARLMAAAEGHARAMAEQNVFGHTGKDGSRFSGRIRAQGYSYSAAAENIAGGQSSAAEVMRSWL
ncbi:MAG: CAP domain-containing protein, partial [Paracoccaceae bacterium]